MRLALSPALRLAVPSILGTASAFLTTLSAAEAALLGAVVIRLAAWFSGEPLRLRRLAAVNGFLILIWCFTPWSTPGVTVASAGVFDITKEGLLLSLLVTMKCNAVFLLFDAFVPGMRLTEVASGLRAARLPMKLVTLLLFMTRETELLSRSYRSLSESVQLRGFRASMNKHSYQTLAAFISTLFIRAYARSRVLNEALILRGFSGTGQSLQAD